MLPGPMFGLEMITSVRRIRYFVIRVLYATVLFLFLLLIYQQSRLTGLSSIAAVANFSYMFFSTFAWLQVLAVAALGPALAAGTIALERERRTIEYLFASQLSNAELIFGKLLARLIHVGCLVLVGLPVLALAMLMGGIAPEALVMLYVLTLSTMIFIGALSMLVSVFARRAREAVMRVYLLLLVLFVLPPIVASLPSIVEYPLLDFLNNQLLVLNPFWVLGNVLTTGSGVQPIEGWAILGHTLLLHGGFSAAALTVATLAVRRVHLAHQGKSEKKKRRRFGWRRPAIGDRPMLWKEMYAEPAAARLGWIGRIAVGLLVAAIFLSMAYYYWDLIRSGSLYSSQSWQRMMAFQFPITVGTLVGCGGLLLIAARAAFSVTSEKERDTWGSVLSTPLEPKEIVWAKVLGNLYAFRWLMILQALLWGSLIFVEAPFVLPVFFMVLTFFILAVYASTLGVSYSLWCKTSMRAMGATLATGIFCGGLYFFTCCMPILVGSRGADEGWAIVLAPCIPFLLFFPGLVYLENFGGHLEPVFYAAYILGVIGYAFAAGALYVSSLHQFNRRSGRTDGAFEHWPSPTSPFGSAAPMAAEPVLAEVILPSLAESDGSGGGR
ncbi:MAG: ABC transporter permease subunit [Pirellulales bacterium]|nr:ABC transporter permease subunit [Pirellulales bacterium]